METNILAEYNKLKLSIEGLQFASNIICNESDSSFISKVSAFFVGKLNSIKQALGFTSEKNKKEISSKDLNAFVQELVKYRSTIKDIVKNVQYQNVRSYKVATVVGLQKNLYDVSNTLAALFDYISKESKKSLQDLDILISETISNKEFRTSTKPRKPDDNTIKILKKLQDELEAMINARNVEDTTTIEKLLPNINSVGMIYENLLDIAAGFKLSELEEFTNTANSIYEKVNILIENMRNEDGYEVSKALISKIGVDIENGAKLITIISSYHYLYNQTVTVFKLLIEKIK